MSWENGKRGFSRMEKTCLYLQMRNYFQNRLNEMSYMKDVCIYMLEGNCKLLATPFIMYIMLIYLWFSFKMTKYFLALTPATHLEAMISANIKYFVEKYNRINSVPPTQMTEGKTAAPHCRIRGQSVFSAVLFGARL